MMEATNLSSNRIKPVFSAKHSSFHIFCKSIAPPPIALESCSNPQKTWQVFKSTMKKCCLILGFSIFVNKSTFGLFGPHHLALGPNRYIVSFFSGFLEIRLKSESFDTLDDLLGFQVQKL